MLLAPSLTVATPLSSEAAQVVVPTMVEESKALDEEAHRMVTPNDPIGIDAYMVHQFRISPGGSFKEGVVRSQRDLFGVFLDRPAGMPDIIAGQTRSTSMPRKV